MQSRHHAVGQAKSDKGIAPRRMAWSAVLSVEQPTKFDFIINLSR
jgi:hypothetical protein